LKILLIGKTGQLGRDILKNNPGHEIYAPERNFLDITSNNSITAMIQDYRPDVVINTAAFHIVPECEIEFEKALQINCIGVRNLAMACKKIGSLFITFSSDYVFDGKKNAPYIEDDKPQPIQMYGISRISGEYAALASYPGNSLIIRTCGLYGYSGARSKGGNFVDKRIQDAEAYKTIDMGCDQTVSPTYTDDLSHAVLRLMEHPLLEPGIYHLVNDGLCTWYDFTVAIYEIMKLKVMVNPVDRGGMSGNMRRPIFSALANTRARSLGIVLPHWKDALERYLIKKYGKQ
jgi:dTDP-4-dehydrorhamnose reductase